MSLAVPHVKTEVRAHSWQRDEDDWYIENRWCSERLFVEERFDGEILDPCCGSGRIVKAARAAGFIASGSDIKPRGYGGGGVDFRSITRAVNVCSNPPFDVIEEFARHACTIAERKVAIIFPTRRLNAAGVWLQQLPLYRTWFLTPRPSMPPGRVALEYERNGKEPRGGKQDFAWLVFLRGFEGRAETRWLHRDKEKQR
ncbi:hypothetical protein [Pseudorhodoplanes sp.]|uniref:hypothetical protein n=1 Tax=Pseudorhodoplanes sp. TaxID=1934341 RepID=UPI002CFE338D|nr:hypothetical protein [Pseudorhodoplanes sp.]HWV44092.1 hypothetical protein [Pseudorhodoplanes sp.]